jgi:hypothetical protein
MRNKDLRIRLEKIREAQTVITNQINLLYNEISDILENKEVLK